MLLSQANLLLDHEILPMETGWVRLPDGQLHIAIRTPMLGCTGKMVEWWFGHLGGTEAYKVWHPRDHVFSDWSGPHENGQYIGCTHLVREYIGGELNELKINFRDPAAIIDVSRFSEAGVSAAIYARGGPMHAPLWTGHVLHLVHDTHEGCVMRSRFWLGDLDPVPPGMSREARMKALPDNAASGMQKHCGEEMSILAGFLPGLYHHHNP